MNRFGRGLERLLRPPSACPACGNTDIRPSRLERGSFLGLLGLAPFRCRACHGHFMARPAKAPSGGRRDSNEEVPVQPQRVCPECGSRNAVESQHPALRWTDRLAAREPYRCLDCRARFAVADRRRLVANLLVGVALLAGLALAASLLFESKPPRGPKLPRLKK